MTDAIVLAGGAATRFGADKLAIEVDGRPLLQHALERVAAVADTIVLVLAPDALPPVLAPTVLLPPARLVVVHDDAPHGGPLVGLAAGLTALDGRPGRSRTDGIEGTDGGGRDDVVLVVGGDMPHLVPPVLRALAAALDRDPALGAAALETEPASPLPLAVRPSLARPAVDALLAADRRSLLALLEALPATLLPAAEWRRLDPDGLTLLDIDTPADLDRG